MNRPPLSFETFFSEICQVDPEFLRHESDLRQIFDQLIKARGALEINPDFVKQLKSKLMAKTPSPINQVNRPANRRWILGFGTAATLVCAALLVSFGSRYLTDGSNTNLVKTESALPFESFGDLSANGAQLAVNTSSPLATPQADSSVTGRGGGGLTLEAPSKMAIAPDYYFQPYKYVYQGDQFEIEKTQMPVYRHRDTTNQAQAAAQALVKQNGLLSIFKKQPGLRIDNASFIDAKGYQFSVSFSESTVGIYLANPILKTGCISSNGVDCASPVFDEQIIKNADDQEIFALAENFLNQFSFDLTKYGSPILDESWLAFAREPDNSPYGIPSYVNVVYPLMLAGNQVYEQGGQPYGLQVGVNLMQKRVDSVWGQLFNDYEASDYRVIKEPERLIQLAENQMYQPENSSAIAIGLGTPEIVYVNWYQYDSPTGRSRQLLVPALRFPILEKPNLPYFNQTSVIIPLAASIVEEIENQNRNYDDGQQPMPMPLLETGAEIQAL